jgi:hypothetical protein
MPAQPEPTNRAEVNPLTDAVLRAAVDNAIHEARRLGTTPPARKPERPAMSQDAVDYSTRILSTGVASVLFGGSASLVMVASGYADATVIAWVCAGAVALPPAIALPVLAFKSLMASVKGVVQAAPPEIHNHYNGDVHVNHREIHTDSKGLLVKNNNRLSS